MSNVDIGLIVSLVGVVIAAITAMIAMCIKLKNKFGELAKDGNWKKLYPMILNAIAEAEATGKSGAEKKKLLWQLWILLRRNWVFNVKLTKFQTRSNSLLIFKKVNKK